jgi:hypothetical protein
MTPQSGITEQANATTASQFTRGAGGSDDSLLVGGTRACERYGESWWSSSSLWDEDSLLATRRACQATVRSVKLAKRLAATDWLSGRTRVNDR